MAFEKAIEADEAKPVSERINVEEIALSEGDYKGLAMPRSLTPKYLADLMTEFKEERRIARSHVLRILLEVKAILEKDPSLVHISVPEEAPEDDGVGTSKEGHVIIWGDIHGQYYDMLNILEKTGMPKKGRKMVFNGDFVDRGSFSCEVVITLFVMKIVYPDLVFLNRGNHETTNMNRVYGFMGETKAKYGDLACDLFREVFNWLPLAHVVDKKVFITHGGLFQNDNVTLEDIAKINRNCEPQEPSLMADMLWSDPQSFPGRYPSKRGAAFHSFSLFFFFSFFILLTSLFFFEGIGHSFGPDVTTNFLKTNNLDLVIRSHEVKPEGYEVTHGGKCITVFSAPNYCDEVGNKAAIITLTKALKPEFLQFTAVPHPQVRPMQYAMNMGFM